MNHEDRVKACQFVSEQLVRKHPTDVLATGVTGSVSRHRDLNYSDIDFNILIRDAAKIRSHRFILKNCLFSVAARTKSDWLNELNQPNYHLPVVVGSLDSMLVFHDPSDEFAGLKAIAKALPEEVWKNAIRNGLEEILEDFGRVRNSYAVKDWLVFRIYIRSVAITAGFVWACLHRKVIFDEKDILPSHKNHAEINPKFNDAIRFATAPKSTNPKKVIASLNQWLRGEALKQDAVPSTLRTASMYVAP